MGTKLHGEPACEVEQTDGEIVRYPMRPIPALPGEWRAWAVVQADPPPEYPRGYRVAEVFGRTGMHWRCSCPAHLYGRGRRFKLKSGQFACKHVVAALAELEQAE